MCTAGKVSILGSFTVLYSVLLFFYHNLFHFIIHCHVVDVSFWHGTFFILFHFFLCYGNCTTVIYVIEIYPRQTKSRWKSNHFWPTTFLTERLPCHICNVDRANRCILQHILCTYYQAVSQRFVVLYFTVRIGQSTNAVSASRHWNFGTNRLHKVTLSILLR